MGRVLGQVVDAMELSPVDLVLHDSALGLSANWISENRGFIRSVVILDSGPALPLWVLKVGVVREIVLGFRFLFEKVLSGCCMKSASRAEAEAHRILLKGRDGATAVVGMGKKLNISFDLSEWSRLDSIKGLPLQVIWSDKWTSEGRQFADAIPQAKFVTHSGGRWMQEHNSEEVAKSIYEFVSSLPKPSRKTVEEPIPEKFGDHHTHGHDHSQAGCMGAYGLGQGWGA